MTGAPVTSTPTPIMYPGHRQRRVKVTAGDGSWVEYIGYAAPNIEPTEVGWTVFRNSYDTNGEFTACDYADKTDSFTKIFNSYASYTYD